MSRNPKDMTADQLAGNALHHLEQAEFGTADSLQHLRTAEVYALLALGHRIRDNNLDSSIEQLTNTVRDGLDSLRTTF